MDFSFHTSELPFLESLLSFLEMDCGDLEPALRRIDENWNRLITSETVEPEMCPIWPSDGSPTRPP